MFHRRGQEGWSPGERREICSSPLVVTFFGDNVFVRDQGEYLVVFAANMPVWQGSLPDTPAADWLGDELYIKGVAVPTAAVHTSETYDRCRLITKMFGCGECSVKGACLSNAVLGTQLPLVEEGDDPDKWRRVDDATRRWRKLWDGFFHLETKILDYLYVSPTYTRDGSRSRSAFARSERFPKDHDFSAENMFAVMKELSENSSKGGATRAWSKRNCMTCSVRSSCEWKWRRKWCEGQHIPLDQIYPYYADMFDHALRNSDMPAWQIQVLLSECDSGPTVMRERKKYAVLPPDLNTKHMFFEHPFLLHVRSNHLVRTSYANLQELMGLPASEEEAIASKILPNPMPINDKALFVLASTVAYVRYRGMFGGGSHPTVGVTYKHTVRLLTQSSRYVEHRRIVAVSELWDHLGKAWPQIQTRSLPLPQFQIIDRSRG